jgi:hypothetical protein
MRNREVTTLHRGVTIVALIIATGVAYHSAAAPEAKLLPDDAEAFDRFGSGVAVGGDTALVGAEARHDQASNGGAVYEFTYSAGRWTQTAKLLPTYVQESLAFGGELALDGDTLLIGARGDSRNGLYAGSVFEFRRTGGSWAQGYTLFAEDGEDQDFFGEAIALDGDTAVIGVSRDDDFGSDSGSVYVFVRSASTWFQQVKIRAPDARSGDRFGEAVALDGDTIVIGAPGRHEAVASSGAVYVYTWTGTIWMLQTKLAPLVAQIGAEFGGALALDGDTALVGADGERSEDGMLSGAGAAYAFTRQGTGWSQGTRLVAADSSAVARFGGRVALEGDTGLISAIGDDQAGPDSGAVYVFQYVAGEWLQDDKLVAPDGGSELRFGDAIALDGALGIVGAKEDDDNGFLSGSAYVFRPLLSADVPAHDRVGFALLVLAMLGAGAYLLRS